MFCAQESTENVDIANADPIVRMDDMLAKRIRNLEKRQQKLDSYDLELKKGRELDKGQLEALEKRTVVAKELEVLKDIKESVTTMAKEQEKANKGKVRSGECEVSNAIQLICVNYSVSASVPRRMACSLSAFVACSYSPFCRCGATPIKS